MSSNRYLWALTLGFAVVAGACQSSTAVDPAVTAAAGTYVLRSINDSTLPYTVDASATSHVDITADTLRVGNNGAFLDQTYLRTVTTGVADGLSSQSFVGTISVSGATVNFIVDGQLFAAGILNGSTLTISGNGTKSVYAR